MKTFTLNITAIIVLYVLASVLTLYLNTGLGIIVTITSIISLCYINLSVSTAKSKLKDDKLKKNNE